MENEYKVIGSTEAFLLVQKRKDTGAELPMYYSEYNGSLNPMDHLDGATRFAEKATVVELATAQNMIATILKQEYEYLVIKETINRADEPLG